MSQGTPIMVDVTDGQLPEPTSATSESVLAHALDKAKRDPSGTEDPLTDSEIQRLREEIDRCDQQIIDAVRRRSEVSRAIGATRTRSGGTKLVHTRELKVIERFSEFGREGHTLAMVLLRLGRGPLGR